MNKFLLSAVILLLGATLSYAEGGKGGGGHHSGGSANSSTRGGTSENHGDSSAASKRAELRASVLAQREDNASDMHKQLSPEAKAELRRQVSEMQNASR